MTATNGYGHEAHDLDWRLQRVEKQTEEHADQLDGMQREVGTFLATVQGLREDNERHHRDMLDIVRSYIDEDRIVAKAKQKRLDRCLGIVETAVDRVLNKQTIVIFAVTVLVAVAAGWGCSGGGASVTWKDWLGIAPVGVPQP